MRKRFLRWLSGWTTTLDIWLHDKELWEHLTRPFDPDDYTDAERPGE